MGYDRTHKITGCILADEMGLGKTLQTIALIHLLMSEWFSLLHTGDRRWLTIRRAVTDRRAAISVSLEHPVPCDTDPKQHWESFDSMSGVSRPELEKGVSKVVCTATREPERN
jgi:hypothetical protein